MGQEVFQTYRLLAGHRKFVSNRKRKKAARKTTNSSKSKLFQPLQKREWNFSPTVENMKTTQISSQIHGHILRLVHA